MSETDCGDVIDACNHGAPLAQPLSTAIVERQEGAGFYLVSIVYKNNIIY